MFRINRTSKENKENEVGLSNSFKLAVITDADTTTEDRKDTEGVSKAIYESSYIEDIRKQLTAAIEKKKNICIHAPKGETFNFCSRSVKWLHAESTELVYSGPFGRIQIPYMNIVAITYFEF